MPPTQLTLVVPGLLGPLPPGAQALPAPPLPGLLTLLGAARSRGEGTGELEPWLCARFGIAPEPGGDWPLAPLLAAQELGDAGTDYWLCADPVHLRADRSRLILFGPEALGIRQAEADALVEGFNALYGPDGLRLYAPAPGRWYLRLAQAPQLSCTPLAQVIGRDIEGRLPRGEAASQWHARLNEIQMLFHAHPVNEARVAQGRPAINSLWPWGGGRMPALGQAPDAWVCSDERLAQALAGAAGVPLLQADGALEDWLPGALARGPGLVVLDACRRALRYGDLPAWHLAQQELEQRWWAPLQMLRRQGRLPLLRLVTPPGTSYEIGAPGWRERLRRRHPLPHYLVP